MNSLASILFGVGLFLTSSVAFTTNPFEITKARTVLDAQQYICSKMFGSANLKPLQLRSDGIAIRPSNDWITVNGDNSDGTIQGMMNNFPVLFSLSAGRDEGGYAEIKIEIPTPRTLKSLIVEDGQLKKEAPKPRGPKNYKFERGVIAALEDEGGRPAAVREIKLLITYVEQMASETDLPAKMKKMWDLRSHMLYIPTAEESDNLNQIRFERMLDVKSNLLQALVIFEELESWGKRSPENLEIARGILGNNNTYSLGLQIFTTILKSPSFLNLPSFLGANQLFRRLTARLHRLVGFYQQDAKSLSLEIHKHIGQVIVPLLEEVIRGNIREIQENDIIGSSVRFRKLLSDALLAEPESNPTLRALIRVRKAIRKSKIEFLSETVDAISESFNFEDTLP